MRSVAIAVVVSGLVAGSPVAFGACVGDCGGDQSVAVNDIVKGVNIALGNSPVGSCSSFDANGDGMVSINELIAAVGNALNGCGFVSPTPTATGTPGPPTATPTQVQPTATATSSVVPPGVDSRMLGTFSGSVVDQTGQHKAVRIKIEVVNNQVRVSDLGGNLFTASGSQAVTMMVITPTVLNYNDAKPPRFAEIFQCGLSADGVAVQYTTTTFSLPPQATSFAGGLSREA